MKTDKNSIVEDYVKENITKVTRSLKSDVLAVTSSEVGVVLNSVDIYALSDAVTNATKLSFLTPKGLENVNNLVDKVISGEKLSLIELSNLKSFSDLVISKAEKLGVNKEPFEKLTNLVIGVQKSSENVKIKTEEFNQNAQLVNQKLDDLVVAVSDLSLKLDSNFIEMLNILRQRYKGVVSSSNPAMINMFSVYIDKVMQTVQNVKSGKEKDPTIFRKLQVDYDKFTENLFTSLAQGKVPNASEMKSYMGESADSFAGMLKTYVVNPQINSSNLNSRSYQTITSSNISQSSRRSNIEELKKLMRFTLSESALMSKITLTSVRKAMENEKVSQAFSEVSLSLNHFKNSSIELNNANKQLEEDMKKLKEFLSSDEFKKPFSNLANNSNDALGQVIANEIRESMARADKLEAKLNLELDTSKSPTIIDLLVKFRKIISQLDIDLRKIKDSENASKLIDDNFLKNSRDVQQRKDLLNKFRSIENKSNILTLPS